MYIDEVELSVLYNARSPEEILQLIKLHEAKLKQVKLRTVEGDESAFIISPITKKTTEAYDQFAQSYHADRAGKLVAQDQLEEFVSFVNPPAKVFEVGTGTGQDAHFLSEKYSVTTVEASEKMAQIAAYECPNADVVQADIINYPLGKNLYKGIWARDSLHHISEQKLDLVFKKLSDALVQGGILYAIVREGEGEIYEKEKKKYTNGEGLKRFYHQFTAEELTNRAEKAGLKVVKIDQKKRSHRWLVGVFEKK
jgi:SAM-dependent methyltransferase